MKDFMPGITPTTPPSLLPSHSYTMSVISMIKKGSPSHSVSITSGGKRYELSDWLGNVRVVINDRKTAVNSGSITLSYIPQIINVTDYYSFGSEITERSYDPVKPKYRFGFNTQEKIFELNKDHYTAKYWEYDARLGRRWNRDPAYHEKPWMSPYHAFSNRPIVNVDFNGANDDWYKDEQGNMQYDENIKSQSDLDKRGIKGTYVGESFSGITKEGYGVIGKEGGQFEFILPEVAVTSNNNGTYDNNGTHNENNGGVLEYAGHGLEGIKEFGERGSQLKISDRPLKSTGKYKYYYNNWGGNQWVKTKYVYNPNLMKGLKYAGGGLGAVITGYEGIEAFVFKDNWSLGKNTIRWGGTTISGTAGAWAGAKLGAWVGTILFPGPGFVIGGAVGAVLGSWGGSEVGEIISDQIFRTDVNQENNGQIIIENENR